MLVFPQLATGAAALYPVTRQRTVRAVVNPLGDGSTVVYADPGAAETEWELKATGLTTAEWNAIEALFEAASGQLQSFTFLDPAGNLAAQSEAFGAAPWSNGALIQLTEGIDDPFGGSAATRAVNTAQTAQGVSQILGIPGNFEYSMTVWARTIGSSSVTLTASTNGASQGRLFPLTAQWQRLAMLVSLGQNSDSVMFGMQLAAGASVDLFGAQVDAQPAPSIYRKTGASGGVYAAARFAADKFTVTAQGTDVYDATIRVVTQGY